MKTMYNAAIIDDLKSLMTQLSIQALGLDQCILALFENMFILSFYVNSNIRMYKPFRNVVRRERTNTLRS